MNIKKFIASSFTYGVILLFILSAFISYFIMKPIEQNSYHNPAILKETANELVLIYIGSSTCGASNDLELPLVLKDLSKKLSVMAHEKGYDYMTIGISSEQDIENGISHLEFTGIEYDEIAIGNGLGNLALQEYMWKQYKDNTSSGLPQIIVLQREYDTQMFNETNLIMPNLVSEEIIYRDVSIFGMKSLLEDEDFFIN